MLKLERYAVDVTLLVPFTGRAGKDILTGAGPGGSSGTIGQRQQNSFGLAESSVRSPDNVLQSNIQAGRTGGA